MRLRMRDEWRFPITNQATRIGFKKTGLTGGGPKPSAARQEGPDGPTKLSNTKVFAFTRRASSAFGRACEHVSAIGGNAARLTPREGYVHSKFDAETHRFGERGSFAV
jgi:hypothetical protein